MAAQTAREIATEIKAHIDDRGGPYAEWYVGITADPRSRLFDEHKVREDTDHWIYRRAQSVRDARSVEEHFINKVGTDGGSGGGDADSTSVYAYKKNGHTDP